MIKIRDRWINVPAGGPLEFAAREIYGDTQQYVEFNRKSLQKFGRNESADTTEGYVNYNGIDPSHPTTNAINTVTSTNAGDTTQTVRIEGMYLNGNDDFIFTVQNIALNGQTEVPLSQNLARCTRIANTSSTTITAGDVYVFDNTSGSTGGVPTVTADIGSIMSQVDQTTLLAATSIASTNYFVCTGFYAYVGAATPTADAVDIRLKIRNKDSVYRTVCVVTVSPNHESEHAFEPYLIIGPNSDIDITAVTNSGTASVSAGFSGYFADIIT